MIRKELTGCLMIISMMSGCASITSEEMQSISLTSDAGQDGKINEADCALKNDRGNWQVKAPGFVSVRRSSEDLLVECKKEEKLGHVRAISRAHGGMWGNIIFGGGIGAVIDHNTGKGYSYPNTLNVKIGESIVVDRSDDSNTENKEEVAN